MCGPCGSRAAHCRRRTTPGLSLRQREPLSGQLVPNHEKKAEVQAYRVKRAGICLDMAILQKTTGGPDTQRTLSLAAPIPPERCIRREGTSEAAPEAVRQGVGGGCQSGWGRLLSVTNAIEVGTWCQGDSGWA